MAIPAMAALRSAFPEAVLTLATSGAVAPLFEEATPVAPDRIFTVEKHTEPAQLRHANAELIVLFTNSFRTAWVARQAGIKERWGYRGHARALLLTRAVRRPGRVHQAEFYRHLVRELGVQAAEALPRVTITDTTRARVAALFATTGIQAGVPIVG